MARFHDALNRRLEGEVVVLEPLAPEHEGPLFEVSQYEDIWRWMPEDSGRDCESFHRFFALALGESEAGARVPFVTLDAVGGEVIGSTSFLALRPEHLSVEIGWTWLSPARWKSGANVEAKLLMLTHAFETLPGELRCRRVEFKTDSRNERSRSALSALPAQFEGIFRKHMVIRNGGVRDSAYYSITDDEWPEVKENLERRLQRRSRKARMLGGPRGFIK